MQKYLQIAQVVVSVFLIVGVLLQGRGAGLGAAFGGGNDYFRTKRGMEKTVVVATIILAVLFLALGIINILVA